MITLPGTVYRRVKWQTDRGEGGKSEERENVCVSTFERDSDRQRENVREREKGRQTDRETKTKQSPPVFWAGKVVGHARQP